MVESSSSEEEAGPFSFKNRKDSGPLQDNLWCGEQKKITSAFYYKLTFTFSRDFSGGFSTNVRPRNFLPFSPFFYCKAVLICWTLADKKDLCGEIGVMASLPPPASTVE